MDIKTAILRVLGETEDVKLNCVYPNGAGTIHIGYTDSRGDYIRGDYDIETFLCQLISEALNG